MTFSMRHARESMLRMLPFFVATNRCNESLLVDKEKVKREKITTTTTTAAAAVATQHLIKGTYTIN